MWNIYKQKQIWDMHAKCGLIADMIAIIIDSFFLCFLIKSIFYNYYYLKKNIYSTLNSNLSLFYKKNKWTVFGVKYI